MVLTLPIYNEMGLVQFLFVDSDNIIHVYYS